MLLGIGFPIAVLFAWFFELTPQGLKATAEVPLEAEHSPPDRPTLNYIVTGLLAAAVVFLILDRFLFEATRSRRTADYAAPLAGNPLSTPPAPVQQALPRTSF